MGRSRIGMGRSRIGMGRSRIGMGRSKTGMGRRGIGEEGWVKGMGEEREERWKSEDKGEMKSI